MQDATTCCGHCHVQHREWQQVFSRTTLLPGSCSHINGIMCLYCCLQVCTGVMIHGYPVVKNLCGGLQAFMNKHGFSSIEEFRGASLPYFTTHTDLVHRQKAAIAEKKARVGLSNDAEWSGDKFVENAESMVANR